MRYVVFDIETTGLDVQQDRIVEIGAVKVEDGTVIEEFDAMMNPGIPMPPQAGAVNGITDDMLVNAAFPGEILARFARFVSDADFLVGHNAKRFDHPFLEFEFQRHFVKYQPLPVRDTVWEARRRLRGLRSYSLAALCRIFQLENDQAHRALSDARVTQQIFQRLIDMDK
jgi:DNA polymerase III epsilon subunit family exonuclease